MIGRKAGKGGVNRSPRRLSLPWLKMKALGLMFKLAFGIRPPPAGDELGEGGELSYTMERCPKAWLDVLYLDEDIRVTRGNKGAVVVVARA